MGKKLTIEELVSAYLRHADTYYRTGGGRHTSRIGVLRSALTAISVRHKGKADSFRANALRATQSAWAEQGLSRTTVNNYTACVKAMFRWAAAREMISTETYTSLSLVEQIPCGRGLARETEPVKPVPDEHIEKVLPLLSGEAADLVRLQLITGARPGELLALQVQDIDRTGVVWTAALSMHKTAWKGRERTLYFGPRAQTILKPYLLGQDRLFKRYADVAAYRRAIARACKRCGLPAWSPNQLRHNAATRIRKEHGLEAAQVLLGHSKADVTQVYAEKNEQQAIQIIVETG